MALDDKSLDLLFREARTHKVWLDKPVDDALLQQIYELAEWGPTSSNSLPMRVVFVKSKEAKEKLRSCLDKGNVEKSMTAPATAIIGMDLAFYEQFPKTSPGNDSGKWFASSPEAAQKSAFRNSSLQGGYFIMAARALGLDCGPMSGFDNDKIDAAFFAGTNIKSNFVCNLGYGDASKLHPRAARLAFAEACRIE